MYSSGTSRERGSSISVSAYPDQGLDVPLDGYETPESRRSLEARFGGQVTPFGTSVVELMRLDQTGALASKCGYCTAPLDFCMCDMRADALDDGRRR